MSPEITFGESAAETVLNEFGVTTDNENYLIYQDSGERVKSYYTEQDIHIDEWGGALLMDLLNSSKRTLLRFTHT